MDSGPTRGRRTADWNRRPGGLGGHPLSTRGTGLGPELVGRRGPASGDEAVIESARRVVCRPRRGWGASAAWGGPKDRTAIASTVEVANGVRGSCHRASRTAGISRWRTKAWPAPDPCGCPEAERTIRARKKKQHLYFTLSVEPSQWPGVGRVIDSGGKPFDRAIPVSGKGGASAWCRRLFESPEFSPSGDVPERFRERTGRPDRVGLRGLGWGSPRSKRIGTRRRARQAAEGQGQERCPDCSL